MTFRRTQAIALSRARENELTTQYWAEQLIHELEDLLKEASE